MRCEGLGDGGLYDRGGGVGSEDVIVGEGHGGGGGARGGVEVEEGVALGEPHGFVVVEGVGGDAGVEGVAAGGEGGLARVVRLMGG